MEMLDDPCPCDYRRQLPNWTAVALCLPGTCLCDYSRQLPNWTAAALCLPGACLYNYIKGRRGLGSGQGGFLLHAIRRSCRKTLQLPAGAAGENTDDCRGTPSKMRRGIVVPQARPTLTLELVLEDPPVWSTPILYKSPIGGAFLIPPEMI